MKVSVAAYGVSMIVEGDYDPEQKQTDTDPAIASQFYIEAVYAGDWNILEMLSERALDRIVEQAISNIEGD